MKVTKNNKYGTISISSINIASVAAEAALSCYGVVGLAPKGLLLDSVSTLLEKNEFAKGVYPRRKGNTYEIDLYVYCAFGVKLTEIVTEVAKKVRFDLEKAFPIRFPVINVFVVDLKEVNDEKH